MNHLTCDFFSSPGYSIRRSAADCLALLLRPNDPETHDLAVRVIPQLLGFLDSGTDMMGGEVEPYFSLVTKILSFPGLETIIRDLQAVMNLVLNKLFSHPVMEVSLCFSFCCTPHPQLTHVHNISLLWVSCGPCHECDLFSSSRQESDSGPEDQVLCGLLHLASTLVRACPTLSLEAVLPSGELCSLSIHDFSLSLFM